MRAAINHWLAADGPAETASRHRRVEAAVKVEDVGQVVVEGSATFGMNLADVRKFVEQTQGWSSETWIDARVGDDRELAALMSLETVTEDR